MIFWLGLISGRMTNFVLSLHSGGDWFDNVGFSLLGRLHVYGYGYEILIVVTRNFFIYKTLKFSLTENLIIWI